MSQDHTAMEVLDRDFLGIRKHVIDVAAALDRIDSAGSDAGIGVDRRFVELHDALRILTDGERDRARRIQMTFSDPYEADWRGK